MQKKAQGLSLNTVVIAAIVLVVLAVLIGIFSGGLGKFREGFDANRETSCPEAKPQCDSDERRLLGNFQPRLEPGDVCCRPVTCGELGGKCMGGCISEIQNPKGHAY